MKFIVLFFAFSTGCASFVENYERQEKERLCSEDGAYDTGLKRGRTGDVINTSVLNACPPEALTALKDLYRKGYELGITTAPKSTH
jgi:hypothetical protein